MALGIASHGRHLMAKEGGSVERSVCSSTSTSSSAANSSSCSVTTVSGAATSPAPVIPSSMQTQPVAVPVWYPSPSAVSAAVKDDRESWDVVAHGNGRNERFQFSEVRCFHEMAFRICVLGDSTEAEFADECQMAEGAWRELRPDLTTLSHELTHGLAPDAAFHTFYQLLVQDSPMYISSLPCGVLETINTRLKHRYLSPGLAASCLHMLLTLSLLRPVEGAAVEYFEVIPTVIGLLEDPCTHEYSRIALTALLFLNRVVGWEGVGLHAAEHGLAKVMGATIQRSQSAYRVLLASSVLARASLLSEYTSLVVRDGGVCSLVEVLLSALRALETREGEEWNNSIASSILQALRPLVRHAVGVSIESLLGVWKLVGKTRVGRLAGVLSDELTQSCGGVLAHQALTETQWGELLSCEAGLLEFECIRRLAKRAQNQASTHPPSLTMEIISRFFHVCEYDTPKSDAVKAAMLQCLSELIRCLPQQRVDNALVAPLMSSLESEAERLGDALIEPCVHLSSCVLRSGQYAACAKMTVKILQALRRTHQHHLYDVPCKNAVDILLRVTPQPGSTATHSAYATRVADLPRECTGAQVFTLCVELLRCFDTMIRKAPRDNIAKCLHLLSEKCGRAKLEEALCFGSRSVTFDEVHRIEHPQLPLPPILPLGWVHA